MIREYLGKKAAETLDRTKFGNTRVGKISTTVLDDARLEDIGSDGLISIGESLNNPYLHYRAFYFAIAVNLISWLSVFLIPSVVSKLVLAFGLIFSKGAVLLLAPALGFTIMGAYSLLRLWFPERNYVPDDGAVMQSYGLQSESLLTWKLWVVSCGMGGINAALLVFTYFAMIGE